MGPDLSGGEICVFASEGNGYKVLKVLVTDETAIHIRLFKNRFSTPPAAVDTTTLTLGKIGDADGFGVGHLPLSRGTFASWAPVPIQREPVTEEELEGYSLWAESGGKTW